MDIVDRALQELGKKGGEEYWRWYGFTWRVDWCAIFICWLAKQLGILKDNIIPKTPSVTVMKNLFIKLGKWHYRDGYTPKRRDLIVFDWDMDKSNGMAHIGIVIEVKNGRVYTVEGNSSDTVRLRDYSLTDGRINGYCSPDYPSEEVVKKESWMHELGKWWYQFADGSYAKEQWLELENKWYYFDQDGWMAVGWLYYKNDWYFLKEDGAMASNELLQIGAELFYFLADGRMAKTNDRGALV